MTRARRPPRPIADYVDEQAPRPAWLDTVLTSMREHLTQRLAALDQSVSVTDRIFLESIEDDIRSFELVTRLGLLRLEKAFVKLEGRARRPLSGGTRTVAALPVTAAKTSLSGDHP